MNHFDMLLQDYVALPEKVNTVQRVSLERQLAYLIQVYTSVISVATIPSLYGQLERKEAEAVELLLMSSRDPDSGPLIKDRYDDFRMIGRILSLIKILNINVE